MFLKQLEIGVELKRYHREILESFGSLQMLVVLCPPDWYLVMYTAFVYRLPADLSEYAELSPFYG